MRYGPYVPHRTRVRGNIASEEASKPASQPKQPCGCPAECFLDSVWEDDFLQLTDKIESLTNAEVQTDSHGVPYIQCTGDWEVVIDDTWRNWWPFPGIYPGGFYIKINRSSGLNYLKASTHYDENVGTNLIATLTHAWYSLEKPASHSSGGLLCQGILQEWYPNAPQYGVSGITNYEAVGLTVFHHDEIPIIPAPTPPYYSYWSSVIVEKNCAPQNITDTPSGDGAIRGFPFQASCGLRQVGDWSLPKRIWGNGSVKIYDIRRVAQRSLLEGGDYTIAWLVSGTQRTPTSNIKIIFEYNPANNVPGSSDRLPPGVFLFRLKHKVYDSQNGTWGTVNISDEAALVFASSLWSSSNINSFLASHGITPDALEYETQQREAYCRPRGCLIFVSNAPNDRWFRTATDINGDRSFAFNTMQESDSFWYEANPEARGAEMAKLYREIRVHAYCGADGPDQFSVYTYCTGSTTWTVNVIATKQTDGYQFSYSGTPLATVPFGEYFVLGLTELPWRLGAWWRQGSIDEVFAPRNVLYSAPLSKTDYITFLEAATFGYWGTAPSGSFVSAAYIPQEYARDEAGLLRLFVSRKAANNPLVLAPCADWLYPKPPPRCPCSAWPTYLIASLGFAFQIQSLRVFSEGGICKFSYGATTSIYKNWSTVATLTNLGEDAIEWRAPAINLVSSTGCGSGVQWPFPGGEIQETFNSETPAALRVTPRFYINQNCELVAVLTICYTGCQMERDESAGCINYQLQGPPPSDFAVPILVPGGIYHLDTTPESGFSLSSCSDKFVVFSETTTETTSAEGNQGTLGAYRGMVVLSATLGPVLHECDFSQIIGHTKYTQTFTGSANFKLVQIQS